MKQEVAIGQVDYTVLVKIRDTAGAPATGLDETDIDIAYSRVETDNDVTTTDVAPAALAALTTAHTDWGFEEVSATDHPGLYRLDIADAVFASGAWSAVVTVTGTGLDPADLEFMLVPQSPLTGVQLAPVTHTSAVIPTVTTTGTATNLTNAPGAGDFTATMKTSIGTAVAASAVASVTGNVGGNVAGTVGGFAAGQGPRIRKNVALASFPFVMTDSTNHAPATGLTVTATRSLDGGAFASCANSVSEIGNGWYKLSLAATDTNADTIAFRFTATGADDLPFTVVTNP